MSLIPSVNYHLTSVCSMRCEYCFAHFDTNRHRPLGLEEQLIVVDRICDWLLVQPGGKRKINFVGGEPTLCPWLCDLIARAHGRGVTTSVQSNGTGLSEAFLRENQGQLDWIGLSVDSLSGESNRRIGRVERKRPANEAFYRGIVQRAQSLGYKLRVGTVVSRYNLSEDFSGFIAWARPARWKLFQVLELQGQNERSASRWRISASEFRECCDRHAWLNLVVETNEAMRGTYLMVAPDGRMLDNIKGPLVYTEHCLLSHSFSEVVEPVGYNATAAKKRGAEWDWR